MKKKPKKAPKALVPKNAHPEIARRVFAMFNRVRDLRERHVPEDMLDRVLDKYTENMFDIIVQYGVLTPEMVGEEACLAAVSLLREDGGDNDDKRRKLFIGYMTIIRMKHSEEPFFQGLLRDYADREAPSAENGVSGYQIWSVPRYHSFQPTFGGPFSWLNCVENMAMPSPLTYISIQVN